MHIFFLAIADDLLDVLLDIAPKAEPIGRSAAQRRKEMEVFVGDGEAVELVAILKILFGARVKEKL